MDDQNSSQLSFYRADYQLACSRSLFLLLKDYHALVDQFFFMVLLASRADENRVVAAKALLPSAKTEEEAAQLRKSLESSDGAIAQLSKFGIYTSRNLTNAIVDTTLWYLAAIIQQCAKKQPQIIKSGQSVKIEEIFDIRTKREIIDYLIERKLNSLSYGGLSELERYIADVLGLQVFSDDLSRQKLNLLIQLRNVNAHNRGIVNRVFLERTKRNGVFDFEIGKRAHLEFDQLVLLSEAAIKVCISFDQKTSEKFGIQRKRFVSWKASK